MVEYEFRIMICNSDHPYLASLRVLSTPPLQRLRSAGPGSRLHAVRLGRHTSRKVGRGRPTITFNTSVKIIVTISPNRKVPGRHGKNTYMTQRVCVLKGFFLVHVAWVEIIYATYITH